MAGNMFVSFTLDERQLNDAGGFIQAETDNFTVGTGLNDDTELANGTTSVLYNGGPETVSVIKEKVLKTKILNDSFYLLHDGKLVQDDDILNDVTVYAIPRLVGGKGGFGSMLRAIGAQIEKTTNREACRDLSGRRLRDINEEKRLKNWIAQQAEREGEAAERRRKKLERLCVEPKHDFNDKNYDKERSELTDNVCDAVEQGFRAASSQKSCVKRKHSSTATSNTKKKACLWMDAGEDELSSSLDSDDSDVASSSLTSHEVDKKQSDGAGCSKNFASVVNSEVEQDKPEKTECSEGVSPVQDLEMDQQTSGSKGKTNISLQQDELKGETDTVVTSADKFRNKTDEQCVAVA